jgi:eukaryotic-like serine/threonine-protein kinase
MLGATVGSYRITGRIGEGGMGVVYVAEHSLLGRTAAIKVLHPELSHQAEIVERFFNEARSASAIRHAGIVEIFDFGYAQDDSAYIVMEHLEGESLRDRLDNAITLDPARAAGIARQIASALQAAHDQEIIHRDLKPDNIFLVPDPEVLGGERAKILDFGIAKLAAGKGGSFRTQTGQLFGTPAYMAPEQCRGAGRVDSRADLYAVGCILYEMICGRPPFIGEGGGEVLAAQIYEEAERPRELAPHLPEPLEAVILRLLEKDPAARYDSATELAKALRKIVGASGHISSQPTPTPTPTPRPSVDAMRTTLASAASATISSPPETFAPDRNKKRNLIAIGAGVATLLGLAAAGVGVLSSRSTPTAEGSQPPPAADARPAARPIIATELVLADAAPLAPGSSDEPEISFVLIDSDPQGAEVYKLPERDLAGTTPLEYELPSTDDALKFLIELDGHRSETLDVDGDSESDYFVELARVRAPSHQPVRRPSPQQRREQQQREAERQREREQAGAAEEANDASERKREAPLNPFTRDRRRGDDDDDDDDALNPFDR